MSVETEVAHEASDETLAALARLLPQLSSTAPPPDRDALTRVLAGDANTVLLARVEGTIVGTLTLVMVPSLTGLRARIEDVVVDTGARGHGAGAALTEEALRLAAEAGAGTVDLTSRPSRAAANRLYERLGFVVRDSRVFRYAVGERP